MSSRDALPVGEVHVYQAPDGQARVDVRIERETVWLSLTQMAELFSRDKSVISRHLRNVFDSQELDREAVVAKNATTAADGKIYQVEFFNLDAILSVGYRVNSKRGTQFRIWATRTLREHLVHGYTLDRQRFARNAAELEAALALVRKAAAGETLTTDMGRGLVDVIARYTQTFLLLQRFDEGLLAEPTGHPGGTLQSVTDARAAIARLKADLVSRGGRPPRTRAGVGMCAGHLLHIQVAERAMLKAIHETSRPVTMAAAQRRGFRRRKAMAPVRMDNTAHASASLRFVR